MARSHAGASRLKWLLILMGLLILIAATHPIWLRALGNLVVYENSNFERADALVVLAGGVPERVLAAIGLLKERNVGSVWLSQEKPSPSRIELDRLGISLPGSLEINRQILLEAGVEAKRIKALPGLSDSTWQEAVATRAFVDQNPIDSLVIVTSNYHSYRAYRNFVDALSGSGVQVYSFPARAEFDPDHWWAERDQIKTLYLELASLLAYLFGFA